MTDSTPDTAASIPYEGADCTPEEAVEAVQAVRATAAAVDWHESCVCGHEQLDHEAGECWATYKGRQCGCWWYTPKGDDHGN